MSAQGLEVIDRSVQATHEWINELAERLDSPDKRGALRLLRAVMCALRDTVGHDEAAHFAAQLPIFLRGVFYEGWRPSATPMADRGADSFLTRVAEHYRGVEGIPLYRDVEEVFRLFNNRLTAGEIAKLRGALKEDLRRLWPECSTVG